MSSCWIYPYDSMERKISLQLCVQIILSYPFLYAVFLRNLMRYEYNSIDKLDGDYYYGRQIKHGDNITEINLYLLCLEKWTFVICCQKRYNHWTFTNGDINIQNSIRESVSCLKRPIYFVTSSDEQIMYLSRYATYTLYGYFF